MPRSALARASPEVTRAWLGFLLLGTMTPVAACAGQEARIRAGFERAANPHSDPTKGVPGVQAGPSKSPTGAAAELLGWGRLGDLLLEGLGAVAGDQLHRLDQVQPRSHA